MWSAVEQLAWGLNGLAATEIGGTTSPVGGDFSTPQRRLLLAIQGLLVLVGIFPHYALEGIYALEGMVVP